MKDGLVPYLWAKAIPFEVNQPAAKKTRPCAGVEMRAKLAEAVKKYKYVVA
ncbi:MAG: hypothetical protein O8C66_14375 [Candidatus Methanoperedens sp.]|nr:hypothetical protein [Candidatus Methanoperedens sp.]MCZ7371686.1 hypothetical protein [Candidatus Methanoperedens sp.]